MKAVWVKLAGKHGTILISSELIQSVHDVEEGGSKVYVRPNAQSDETYTYVSPETAEQVYKRLELAGALA